MKKITFMLISFIVLTSCQQDESIQEKSNIPELRTSTYPTDPINQIIGIPVNIKLTSNTVSGNNYYMSAQTKNAPIVLYSKDDNSGRQKWVIRKSSYAGTYNIELLGGGPKNLKYMAAAGKPGDYYPTLSQIPLAGGTGIVNVPGTNLYNIGNVWGGSDATCIGAKSYNSTNLKIDKVNSGDAFQNWEITPIEEFQLVNIYYEMGINDKFSVVPRYIKKWTVNNQLNTVVTRNIAISEKTSNTASFSETKGLKVSLKVATEAKFGVPLIAENKINTEITTDKSWSYTTGATETKELSITDNLSHTFKPGESITVEIIGTEYQMDLTYIAELKSIKGTKLYLRGKWNGMIVNETNIYLKDKDGNIITKRTLKLQSN